MRRPSGKPCRECPFRRKSLPGYLGEASFEAYGVETFLAQGLADIPTPCHKSVDWERPDRESAIEKGRECSGRAIFWANQCKTSRSGDVSPLPANPEAVFTWPQEFRDHHSQFIDRIKKGRSE